MPSDNTLVESGLVRIYREVTAGDIDTEKALIEILNNVDGLVPTMLDGHVNSVRISDGSGLAERRVVRGDGVNTLLADSSALATTLNILGMTLSGQVSGANARYATPGSIIDGFGGTLTKHAVYYLGTSGQISLTPGTVEVIVGIAIDADKFLFAPCCCAEVGSIHLNHCFSSAMFTCEDGAHYCVDGPGTPECIPALKFDPSVDQYWYCGFGTPNEMDPSQAAELELTWYTGAGPANPVRIAANLRSVAAGASIFAGGSVYTVSATPATPGVSTLFQTALVIPASTLTNGQMNRLTLCRAGTDPADTFAGDLYLINAQLKYLIRCSP